MSNDNKGFDPLYDDIKSENIILAGKPQTKPDGSTFRKVELLLTEDIAYLSEKSNESDNTPVVFEIKDKVVLYESRGGQQKIHCWLIASVDGTYLAGLATGVWRDLSEIKKLWNCDITFTPDMQSSDRQKLIGEGGIKLWAEALIGQSVKRDKDSFSGYVFIKTKYAMGMQKCFRR